MQYYNECQKKGFKEVIEYFSQYDEEFFLEDHAKQIKYEIKRHEILESKLIIEKIPITIIVRNILIFIEIEPIDEFSLYGYSKKDVLRNVTLVFRSILLGRRTNRNYQRDSKKIVVDWKRVERVNTPGIYSNETPISILWEFKNLTFSSLRKLRIVFPSNITDSFFQLNSFPNLEVLTIGNYVGKNYNVHGVGWNKELFRNLKCLSIRYCHNFVEDFFILNLFPKLEFLFIQRNQYLTGEGWNDIPSLREISIEGCFEFKDEFFRNFSLDNLSSLSVECCKNLTGKYWKSCKNLRKFKIDSSTPFEFNHFFSQPKVQKMEELILGYRAVDANGWQNLKSLRQLFLRNCRLTSFFQNQTFDNLRILIITNNWETIFKEIDDEESFSKCNEMKNLEVLEMRKIKCISDNFFKLFDFLKLKRLKLVIVKKITGIGYKRMDNLDNLEISHCESFVDSFFREHSFGVLKSLKLCGLPCITSIGWKEMIGLEKIHIEDCEKFFENDLYFKENVWKSDKNWIYDLEDMSK